MFLMLVTLDFGCKGPFTKADTALKNGHLTLAQDLYVKYFNDLDTHIVPPYQDYFRIQQSLWKISWMRHGNSKIGGTRVPIPAMESVMSLESLD